MTSPHQADDSAPLTQAGTLPGVFITGTDTGVGKTRVTAWLVMLLARLGVRVAACKPAVSGSVAGPNGPIWEDVERLLAACPEPVPPERLAPYRWHSPLAPPAAADADADAEQASSPADKLTTVARPTLADLQRALLAWEGHADYLMVEGVGGVLCPITPTETVVDLMQAWGRPALLVARAGLGTLNHTLLSLEALAQRRIPVLGVVVNRTDAEPPYSEPSNLRYLRQRLPVPVYGPVPYAADETAPPPATLADLADRLTTASRAPLL